MPRLRRHRSVPSLSHVLNLIFVPECLPDLRAVATLAQLQSARVQVSVDGSTWDSALVGEPSGPHAWCAWEFPWEARPGDYELMVRATDELGPQPGRTLGHVERRAPGHVAGFDLHATVAVPVDQRPMQGRAVGS